MGTCRYCGQEAGTLRFSHKECAERHALAVEKIPEFFIKAIDETIAPERFRELAVNIAGENFIDDGELRSLVIKGLTEMIEHALEDQKLTGHEGGRINALRSVFGIGGTDKDFSVVAHKLKKAEILRDLADGRVPDGIEASGLVPINLSKGEKIIWMFNNVSCLKTRTRSSYVGRSQGISFRVARGVSFRVGSFKGHPIRTKELVDEGTGNLVLTSKHLFFVSSLRTFKIPAKKIVSIEPFSDGVAILRDGANALPTVFKLDDPWFAANAIANLNQLDS